MIKKACQLVPVSGSLREFKAGVLVKLKNTNQFGTLRKGSLRGKFARRNLRNTFKAIKLCAIDDSQEVGVNALFTLKDGSLHIGCIDDMIGSDIAGIDNIVLNNKEIMQSWVFLPAQTGNPVKFYTLTPKIVKDILDNEGRIWVELYYPNNGDGLDTSPPKTAIKLVDGYPIIHLQP